MELEFTRDFFRIFNYLVCYCFGLILGMDNKNFLIILNLVKIILIKNLGKIYLNLLIKYNEFVVKDSYYFLINLLL